MEPEQMDKLFKQTLTGDYDDESPWEAVRALKVTGSRDVFVRAAAWCSANDYVVALKRHFSL